jgi:DNA polymerase-3 subunit epsilon
MSWQQLLGWLGRGRSGAAGETDDTRWVVIDVESTGLDPRSDRLVAIAGVAVHAEGGAPAIACGDSFEVVVQHDESAFDRQNILVHGVGIGARRRGVPLAQALQAFEDWAGPAPRLGFHVDFDRVLIERARRVAGLPATAKRWIDLAPLAAAMHPQVRAHALDEWLEHFGIECLARHEAVADTLATAELWLLLWPALQRAGVRGSAAAQALARNQRWLQR